MTGTRRFVNQTLLRCLHRRAARGRVVIYGGRFVAELPCRDEVLQTRQRRSHRIAVMQYYKHEKAEGYFSRMSAVLLDGNVLFCLDKAVDLVVSVLTGVPFSRVRESQGY